MPNAKFTTLLNQVSNTNSSLEICIPHIHHIKNKQLFRGMPSGGYLNNGEFAKIKPLVDNQNIYQVVSTYPADTNQQYYEHTDGKKFYGGTIRTEIKFTDRNQYYYNNNDIARYHPKPLLMKQDKICINFKVRPVKDIFHKDSNRAKIVFQIFPQPHSITQMNKYHYSKITKTSNDEYVTNYPEPLCQVLFAKDKLWLKLCVGSYVADNKERPFNAKFYLDHPQGDPDIKGKDIEEAKQDGFVRAWQLKDFSNSINEHKGSDQWTNVWLTVDPSDNQIECSVDDEITPRIKFKGRLHKPYYVIHNDKNTRTEIDNYGYYFKSGLITSQNNGKPASETNNNIVWVSDIFAGESYEQIRQYQKQPDAFDLKTYIHPIWDNPNPSEGRELFKKYFQEPQIEWQEGFNKS